MLLARLLAAALACAADQERYAWEDRLLHAPWEDRLRVVRTLAARGPEGRELLELAAKDPDWQVRAAAAEGLAGAGARAERALQRLAAYDECRLVRLAAAHSLGRLGAASPAAREGDEDASSCSSAYLPNDEARRAKAVKARDSTRPDEAGCAYLRFQRLGKDSCPRGMAVHGIGRPPDSPKLLKVRGADGGVALCCPDTGAVPEPVEVECRLIPDECPPPWSYMDEPADARTGKEGRYRRSERHALGDLDWVQCCRPVPVERPEAAPEETARAIPDDRRDTPRRKAPPPQEPPAEEPPPRPDEGPSPESLIAARALARLRPAPEALPRSQGPAAREEAGVEAEARRLERARTTPEAGLDAREARGAPETLPAPEGISGREEADVSAQPRREEPEREPPSEGLDPRRALGARETLPAPAGAPARAEAPVTGAAERMADAGLALGPHDPLPVLIEHLKSPQAAVRARAAEMIGARGTAAVSAAPELLAALSDSNPRVRSDAALALGSVTAGTDRAVKALRRLLKDGHPDVRYSAAAALGRVGTPAAAKAFSGHLRGASKKLGP